MKNRTYLLVFLIYSLLFVSRTFAQITDTGDKVGVGVTAPKEKFQIGDRWTFHNGGHKLISYNWYFSGGEKRIVDDEASAIRFTSEGDIQFSTAPYGLMNSTVAWQTPLFLTNSGRVGMGTSTPQHALDVINYFQANSESQLFIGQNHDFGANSGRYGIGLGFQHIDGTGQGKKYHLSTWFANTRTNVLTFDYQGNVGVGTSSPVANLDVNADLSTPGTSNTQSWTTGNAGYSLNLQTVWDNGGINQRFVQRFNGVDFNSLSFFSGKVGIGTNTPLETLQIGDYNSGNNKISIPGVYNFENLKIGQFGNGAAGIEFINHTNLTESYGIKLLAHVDQAYGFQIQYAPASTNYSSLQYSTGLFMGMTGNVGIGTTKPSQKLEVKGTVYSTEVKVDVNAGSGPDYVFEPTYNLPTLAETEAYIKANKHLPEVPSAKEMEANGINLSEMNMLLLKKVEELTLHLIESEKRNIEYEKRLKLIEETLLVQKK